MRIWQAISRPLRISWSIVGALAVIVTILFPLLPPDLITQNRLVLFFASLGIPFLALVILSAYQFGKNKSIVSTLSGVKAAFRRHEGELTVPLTTEIENARSDIFFLGLSLPTLDSYIQLLERKAHNRVHIRLLVPDPCDDNGLLIKKIAEFLNREGPYPRELSTFFNNFLPVWRKESTYFEVRVHNQLPSVSASIYDHRTGNINIIMYGVLGGDRLVVELDFGGAAGDYRESLDRLWKEATPLITEQAFRERIRCADEIAQELAKKSSGGSSAQPTP